MITDSFTLVVDRPLSADGEYHPETGEFIPNPNGTKWWTNQLGGKKDGSVILICTDDFNYPIEKGTYLHFHKQ